MLKKTIPFALVLGVSLTIAQLSFSKTAIADSRFEKVEEPDRGRLSDGRAFRKDAQGNQLVDYIAELEINIEELNRRVHGLEDEVEKKQQRIDSLSKSGASTSELLEKNLVAEKSAGRSNIAAVENSSSTIVAARFVEPANTNQKAAEVICPKIECPVIPKAAANTCPEIKCPASPRDMKCPPVVTPDCSLATKAVNDELEQSRIDLAIEKQDRAKDVAELKTARLQIETFNQQQASETARLSDQLAKKSAELERLKLDLDAANDQLKSSQSKFAELNDRITKAPAVERVQVSEPERVVAAAVSLSPAKQRALDSVKGNLLNEVNSLRGLIGSRDSGYQRYSRNAGKIQFRPTAALSSKGRDLGKVSQAIRTAASVYELMLLRSELSEIRGKIQEDLALISRMGKVR